MLRAHTPVLTLAVLAAGICLCGRAEAQGDDMERAKEAYTLGQRHFDAGEYAEALEAFQRSFDAFPHFRTIFSLALCFEKLGEVERAVEAYRRYVDWSGEVPNRGDVERKIEELRALLPPEPEPAEDTAEGPEPEPEPAPETPPETPQQPGTDLRTPGWVVIGTGAAAVVVGGVMLGLAQRSRREMEDVEGVPYDPAKHDPMKEDGETFEKAGWICGGIGVAALAAGVIMLLVSDVPGEGREGPGLEAKAVALEGGGALTARWRF
jgi:hypothetical protein